ncbi:MAG: hypothetical protein ABW022_09600 [Actinoplanes sp.]
MQQWVIRDGVAPSQIGARLGLSRATGYEWLRRYAIRSDRPVITQQDLLTRWRSGPESAERVADETGLPADAVAERLITARVMTSSRPYVLVGTSQDPLPEDQLRVWHLDQSLTAGQIAALTGTTVRQVRYRLSQYGLSRRRGTPAPPPAPSKSRPVRRRIDPTLMGRAQTTRERARVAAATAADTVGLITETVERLRATTVETRRAVRRAGVLPISPIAPADQP